MGRKEIEIKELKPDDVEDFMASIQLFKEVFDMKDFSPPSTSYIQKLLEQQDFHVFTAIKNERIVGALTSYVLKQYYAERPLAYIFDLAVSRDMQRRRIGTLLMEETIRFFKEKGFEEVFVQADQAEQHAVDFYRSTKPTEEEKVIHFYYCLHP